MEICKTPKTDKEPKCGSPLSSRIEKKSGYCEKCLLKKHPLTVLRKVNKLGQMEFSKILGISQSNISKIESNILDIRIDQLDVLRKKFKINLNKFVVYKSDPKSAIRSVAHAKLVKDNA